MFPGKVGARLVSEFSRRDTVLAPARGAVIAKRVDSGGAKPWEKGVVRQMEKENEVKIDELAETFSTAIKSEARRLARSGATDEDSYKSEDYLYAKALVTASIHRLKNTFAPPAGFAGMIVEIENLKRI